MSRFVYYLSRTLLLLVLLSCFTHCQKDILNKLDYTVKRASIDNHPALNIQIKFQPGPGGTTKILYDNEAWGEENLFNCISNMTVIPSEIKMEVSKDSGWIILHHPKDLSELIFKYTLQQDFEEKGKSNESYRPIIQDAYFHVFSHNMFMVPEHLASKAADPMNVQISWEDFPEDYAIHNSFGTASKKQSLSNIPLHEFHQAIFVGGDYRIYTAEINENKIYLASRGKWVPFNDTTVLKVLSHTIKAQREFWKDHSQPYFTVTMRPVKQETGSSFQGTGLTNSFATSISNNTHTDIEQLVYLFNHELQHNWIGHAIENSNEEEQYWFSEGFTEYYTIKNIAKNRIHNLDTSYFISQFNEIIRNLYGSPVKEAPNSEINYDNFWSDRDYSKLPYYRGAVFAFYLDQLIATDSNGKYSLDDLMHQLLRGAKEEGKKITHDYFIATVNNYLNGTIGPFFNTHIEKGKLMPLEEIFKNMGFDYNTETEIFDLGFRLAENEQEVIWVDPASSAFAAGLRVGDQLGSRSIYYGNISKPVELTLSRGSLEKDITYYPSKEMAIPQLMVTEENMELLRFGL